MADYGKLTQSNNFRNSLNSNYSKNPEIIEAFPTISKRNMNLDTLQDQKIPKTKSPKKSQLLGRDEKIDPDLYYHVKDENEKLKKEKIETNDKIKRLEVSLANIKAQLIKERKLADQRVINMDNSKFDKDFKSTKLENEKLKEQNTKLRTFIKGLQSDQIKVPNFNKSNKNFKTKKKNPLEAQREKNSELALISHLREQIRNLTDDRNNLIQELESKTNNNFQTLKSNKNTLNELADLKTGYEKSNLQLDTNNKILQLTRATLQEMTQKYEQERDKNRQLETRISLMKGDQDKMNDYQSLIEEYKKREKLLENRIEELCDSPFIKQAEERGNLYKKYTENEKALTEAERLNKEYEIKIKNLESKNKELDSSLKIALIEKDKYKDECTRIKYSKEEKEKNDKLLQQQLNSFGKYGEIDSNFSKLLNVMKLKTDGNNWSNMNFLEQMNYTYQSKDPIILNKEIERLKIEKGTLGSELEKTKSLLQIQQQINEDMKKIQNSDIKKYKIEIQNYKDKIEELCKLIDIKNIPKEYIPKNLIGLTDTNKLNTLLNKRTNLKESDDLMFDKISEFSKDENETDFSLNENAVDLYLGECNYEDGIDSEIGFNLEDMRSFLCVDFFLHETQTSNVLLGKDPMFNLQITYRVNIDENLLNYLESEYIYIEIYYLRDNEQVILAKGKIPLIDLINIKSDNTNSRVINKVCPCYSINDNGLKIASLHYKMRTRNPISEALKWYREQNKFITDVGSVDDNMNKEDKIINDYSYIGSKVYIVKILIKNAKNLICSGPPRRISPYFYYKFYKENERYSNISSGNDPEFEDVASFTVVFDSNFENYLLKETLNIYIFDSSNPIEVDVSKKDAVTLVNTKKEIQQDLIGVCRVPLNDLINNDTIQGPFPIFNVNNREVGQLVITIFWEEIKQNDKDNVNYESTFKTSNNALLSDTKAFDDILIIKLANALKEKGLNVESAFNIFDQDNKGEISIMNFTNTVLFTLKFTNDQNELAHLIKIIYTNNNISSLNRMGFYNIFAILLSPETKNLNLTNTMQNKFTSSNMITTNDAMKFTIISNQDTKSRIVVPEKVKDKTFYSNDTLRQSDSQIDLNREVDDIYTDIKNKMFRAGKSSDLELFRLFDKDSNSSISRDELRKGLNKIGVNLSKNEANKLFDEICEKKGDIGFSFREFKKFYKKNIESIKTENNEEHKLYNNIETPQGENNGIIDESINENFRQSSFPMNNTNQDGFNDNQYNNNYQQTGFNNSRRSFNQSQFNRSNFNRSVNSNYNNNNNNY